MVTASNFFNSISNTKEDDYTQGEIDKDYKPYVVNKMLSKYKDLIHVVNEMNMSSKLDKRMQFDFLMQMVPKKQRRVLWSHSCKNENIPIIMEWYNISEEKAEQYLKFLKAEEIEFIRDKMERGGKK